MQTEVAYICTDKFDIILCTIHYLDIPNPPCITRRTDFDNDTFTVILDWYQFSGETYNVITVPQPIRMSFITSTSVWLVLLYNTEYNVTVTATLCGHRNASNFTTIYYGITAHIGKFLTDLTYFSLYIVL